MATHVIVRYDVIDEEAYGRYRELAGPSVAAHGGIFVVKGVVTRQLEGCDSANFALIEFPSVDQATAWYGSDEYQRACAARKDAGDMTISIVS